MTNLQTAPLSGPGYHHSHLPHSPAGTSTPPKAAQRLFWRCNLPSIYSHIDVISRFPFKGTVPDLPTLLIYGTKADYVRPAHVTVMQQMFPKMEVLPLDAGHWVHAERTSDFVSALVRFMASSV